MPRVCSVQSRGMTGPPEGGPEDHRPAVAGPGSQRFEDTRAAGLHQQKHEREGENDMNQSNYTETVMAPATPHAGGLTFDPSEGQPIVILPVSEHEGMATMKIGQLLQLVPDPRKAENAKELEQDPTLRAYAELRRE